MLKNKILPKSLWAEKNCGGKLYIMEDKKVKSKKFLGNLISKPELIKLILYLYEFDCVTYIGTSEYWQCIRAFRCKRWEEWEERKKDSLTVK